MKKNLLRILKIAGILIALMLVLFLTIGILLNTHSVQNRLISWATEALSEKLHTKVTIESVDIDFFTYDVRLHGLSVEDLQHQPMLQLELLTANVQLWPLLHREVNVSSVRLKGLQTRLYQLAPDSAANYQFIIDAFKKEKSDSLSADSIPTQNSTKATKKEPLELNLKEIILEELSLNWTHFNKKGPEDVTASLERITCKERNDNYHIAIKNLRYANDNRQPRRNDGKPKRGAFDAHHLDITSNADLVLHLPLNQDVPASTLLSRAQLEVSHLDATDSSAGLHLKHLSCLVTSVPAESAHSSFTDSKGKNHTLKLSNIDLQLPETTLRIDSAQLQLPSKKAGIPLAYTTSPIHAHVLLRDIAKPFAPVLSKFALPLSLQVSLSGDATSMNFRNIRITTLEKKFQLTANGRITDLNDKYKLALRFDVNKMKAEGGIKERIISQFPVKKLMMKELHTLGTITFQGHFHVLHKRDIFIGKLSTQVGNIDLDFALDEKNKYVIGKASTNNLLVGKVFDVENLGSMVANAEFKIDISKLRTAKIRRLKGGKLPIGTVKAHVDECSWRKIRLRNIDTDIISDGAVAEGNICLNGKRTDLLCAFSLTKTDSVNNKLKVKPGIRFHALSDEDKAKKTEKKARKAEEKARKAEQRAKEKAEKKAYRAEKKARKKEERARKKSPSQE